MKRKILLLGITCALLLVGLARGTFAAFQTATREMGKADIQTKELKVKVYARALDENGKEVGKSQKVDEDGMAWGSTIETILPGKEWTESIVIENPQETEEGYPLYARVIFYKAWGEEKDGIFIKDYNLNPESIQTKLQETEDWIEVFVDEEQSIYYYKHPLAAKEQSAEMQQRIKIANQLGNAYMEKSMNMIVRVEAVQAAVKEDSFLSVWGIEAEFDENGAIINGRQQ